MRLISNKQNSIKLPVKVLNSVAFKYVQDFRELKKYVKFAIFSYYSLRFGMSRKSMSGNLIKNKYFVVLLKRNFF